MTLRRETEEHTQSSKNNSGSGEIGFSIGAPTGWYVPASTAKGSGNGTTHVETLVDADRNLSIISEQDTDDYASKQSQADGTFLCGSERWSGGQHLSFVARRGCLQLCYQPSLAPPERCWRPMEWSVVGGCWQSLVR
ncbi:hemagglutinin repeat-containing protein [Stenotrophomonas maltophilia]|nr:hemagglutinin repeat-containing protein [Stenotrophomonas maltophilia]